MWEVQGVFVAGTASAEGESWWWESEEKSGEEGSEEGGKRCWFWKEWERQ